MPNVTAELDDNGLAQLAVTTALRQLGGTMDRMANTVESLSSKVGDVHTDVQILKVQHEAINELRGEVKELKTKVSNLELRDAQQDGAAKLLGWMKDFGPWLIAILAFVWGLFGRHPS